MITVKGKQIVWNENLTVKEALNAIGYNFPYPMLLVKVNNKIVKKDEWDAFKIPDDSDIDVLPVLGGG